MKLRRKTALSETVCRSGRGRRHRGISLVEVVVTMALVIQFATVTYSAIMMATQLRTVYANRYTATCEVADILECYRDPELSFSEALSFYGKIPWEATRDETDSGIFYTYLFKEPAYSIRVTIVERETSYDFTAVATLNSDRKVLYEYTLYQGIYS